MMVVCSGLCLRRFRRMWLMSSVLAAQFDCTGRRGSWYTRKSDSVSITVSYFPVAKSPSLKILLSTTTERFRNQVKLKSEDHVETQSTSAPLAHAPFRCRTTNGMCQSTPSVTSESWGKQGQAQGGGSLRRSGRNMKDRHSRSC